MLEFDAAKLVIIGIVALIVIGPKELPRVMRQIGQAIAKIRRLGAEFQAQFTEAMNEADLAEIKAEAAKISEAARLDTGTDPLGEIRAELTRSVGVQADVEPQPAKAALPGRAEPLAEPLAEALRKEQPEIALEAVELRDPTPKPLAAAPITQAAEPLPERALDPEPLRNRG